MKGGWMRIPCSHAQELLSERMDGPLTVGRRLRLWLHLAFCDSCTRIERQLALLRAAMRRLGS